MLLPIFAPSQGIHGQLYASKVIVFSQQQGFSVPKGSPLQANVIPRPMKRDLGYVKSWGKRHA